MIKIWGNRNLVMINILSFLFIALSGCKTNANVECDAYGENIMMEIPYTDTLVMDSFHFHFEEEQMCCWIPTDTTIYTDTIYLEILN